MARNEEPRVEPHRVCFWCYPVRVVIELIEGKEEMFLPREFNHGELTCVELLSIIDKSFLLRFIQELKRRPIRPAGEQHAGLFKQLANSCNTIPGKIRRKTASVVRAPRSPGYTTGKHFFAIITFVDSASGVHVVARHEDAFLVSPQQESLKSC